MQKIRAYKHLRSEFARDALKHGVFKLSRISEFRRLESGPLADPHDGVALTHIDKLALHADDGPRDLKLRDDIRPWFNLDPQQNIVFENISLKDTTPDLWTLCLSSEQYGPAADAYDATILIEDVLAFTLAIRATHPDTLGDPTVGRVEYKETSGWISESGVLRADPFTKGPRFEPEQEIRIVWEPWIDDQQTIFMTKAKSATRHLRRIR